MAGILLDTHVWAWTLSGVPKLSRRASSALGSAEIFVSPISIYEIAQKV